MHQIECLQQFISGKNIPLPAKKQPTFFDITGCAYDENVISRWYAYFLRHEEEHGLNHLLIDSLLAVIHEKTERTMRISHFEVKTEEVTVNRNRIDILIKGRDEDEGKFIIIENKIYHVLNNDLKEYWTHCLPAGDDKIGIVLSLTRELIPECVKGKFINVLHSELINQVRIRLYGAALNSYYLADFINAIDNLNKYSTMNNEVAFYFENIERCNIICDLKEKSERFITSQIAIAGNKLELKQAQKGKNYSTLAIPGVVRLLYNINYENLLNTQAEIQIALELSSDVYHRVPEIDNKVGKLEVTSRGLDYQKNQRSGSWTHYASRTYHVEMKHLHTLSEFIVEKITTDFYWLTDIIIAINHRSNQ